MNQFLPHTCHKCGHTGESALQFSGPHIKQVCAQCSFYVKFISTSSIPDVREIKLKIWSHTQDLNRIAEAKKAVDFIEGLNGLSGKMMYWRLYLEILKNYLQ